MANIDFPQFARFQLERCNAAVTGLLEQKRLMLKVEQFIKLELQEFEDPLKLRALVNIGLKTFAFDPDKGEDAPVLTADVDYVAEFHYPDGTLLRDVEDVFTGHEYQRQLVSQAFPLAVSRLRDLYSNMGVMADNLPLTPP